MHKKRIMVIETDAERFKQVNFLLRLAGYESRLVANVREAANWARVCHLAGEEEFCLLINSVESSEECLSVLQPLAHYAFPLPVVLVRRGQWDGDLPTMRFPTLRILCCPPATINAALSAVAQSSGGRARQPGRSSTGLDSTGT